MLDAQALKIQKRAVFVTCDIPQARNIFWVFISVINQLDAHNFCFTVSFISCLYMFRAHVLIIRRSKLHTRGRVIQF